MFKEGYYRQSSFKAEMYIPSAYQEVEYVNLKRIPYKQD
jgi:hypothetical protein